MDPSLPNSPEQARFLETFFARLNKSMLPYAVMRNYEGLPFVKTGNDIDIMVNRKEIPQHRRLLMQLAEEMGWKIVQASDNMHLSVYKLARVDSRDRRLPDILHFDYFPGDHWYGAQFIESERLLEKRVRYGDIFVLDPLGRVLCLLLHHLLWSGSLGKEKYREDLSNVVYGEPVELRKNLDKIVGKYLTNRLIRVLHDYLRNGGFSNLTSLQNDLRLSVVYRALRNTPVQSAHCWINFVLGEIRKRLHPAGLLVVIWFETGIQEGAKVIKSLMPWLWLLDRHNHAFVGPDLSELLTHHQHPYHGNIARQYSRIESDPTMDAEKGFYSRFRFNLSRGRVVVLQDGDEKKILMPLPRRGIYILVASDPGSHLAQQKLRQLRQLGLHYCLIQPSGSVEKKIADYIIEQLFVRVGRKQGVPD